MDEVFLTEWPYINNVIIGSLISTVIDFLMTSVDVILKGGIKLS